MKAPFGQEHADHLTFGKSRDAELKDSVDAGVSCFAAEVTLGEGSVCSVHGFSNSACLVSLIRKLVTPPGSPSRVPDITIFQMCLLCSGHSAGNPGRVSGS